MVRDKILELIRLKGPVIPSQINKEINSSILIASATLGELASKNHLKISCLKIGGTPLYYLPGQEPRLQNFSDKLNEKDKQAYDLLRYKRVLRDRALTPLTRVALRQIKDFATPLNVRIKDESEIFWKWYLTSDQEAESLIREILEKHEPKSGPEKKIGPEPEKLKKDEGQEILKPVAEKEGAEKHEKTEKQTKPKLKREIKKEGQEEGFLASVSKYFSLNNINVVEQTVLRKTSEADFIIKVPSAVGPLTYFCKAKGKKSINDGDLSSAYFQGQSKKLPVLFLTFGSLTKKAQHMLEKEFKGMHIKRI